MALDVKSATKLILEGTNIKDHQLDFNYRANNELFGNAATFESSNFVQSDKTRGTRAKAARDFMLAMMPKFEGAVKDGKIDSVDVDARRLEAAVRALGAELRRWTRMDAADLQDVEAVEAMGQAIVVFASHLFFGMALEPELVAYIFPVPGFFPTHPYFLPAFLGFRDWIPSFLMPSWWKARYISGALFDQMKKSPNWSAYRVTTATTKVYVSFRCRDDDQLIISRDRNEFDKSQDTEKVALSTGDRLVVADIVGEDGKSISENNKPFALRFEEGWIGVNERMKVPQKEGWVKIDDLEKPLIVRVLEECNKDNKGEVLKKDDDAYISDDDACGNMLVALGFNAFGLSNPLLMPFFVLPELLKSNPKLGEDDEFLESFAWELLRHNGTTISRKIDQKISRVQTSKGCPFVPVSDNVDESLMSSSDHKEYTVPEGTTVFTHLGMLQRDRTYWERPHTFMADRFVKSEEDVEDPDKQSRYTSANEAFPVLGFGYPLQGQVPLDYESDVVKKSHGSVFGPLMQPFLKMYLHRLVNDFTFGLEKRPPSVQVSKVKSGRSHRFAIVEGFGPGNIKGGPKADQDMLPKLDGGVRFAFFSFKDEVIEREWFDLKTKGELPNGYDGIKDDGTFEELTCARAPGISFKREHVGENVSEMKYAKEFNQVYPAFQFATDPSKSQFAEKYMQDNPSHRVVPDGMDLEMFFPPDEEEPGMRMGDSFIHVSKVLLQRPQGQASEDETTAAQARAILRCWDLTADAQAKSKKWDEWDWDPWAKLEGESGYTDTREHKRQGFRKELEDAFLLDRSELKVSEAMYAKDNSYLIGNLKMGGDVEGDGMTKTDGILSLRKQLTNKMVELTTEEFALKLSDKRESESRSQMQKEIEDIRERLQAVEMMYIGFKREHVEQGLTIMEAAGCGWCSSRRLTDDDSEENASLVHWDSLGVDGETGDKIRAVAILVRDLSGFDKGSAELAELTALRFAYETVDLDDDGVVEHDEIAASADIEREMRKIRAMGGWTLRFIRGGKVSGNLGRDPTLDEVKLAMHRAKAEVRGKDRAFARADRDGNGILEGNERVDYYTDLANQKRLAEIGRQARAKARGRKVQLVRPPPHPPHRSLGRSKKYSDEEFLGLLGDVKKMLGSTGKPLRLGDFNRDEEAEYYLDHPDEKPENWDELMEAYYCEHPIVASQSSGNFSTEASSAAQEVTNNPMLTETSTAAGDDDLEPEPEPEMAAEIEAPQQYVAAMAAAIEVVADDDDEGGFEPLEGELEKMGGGLTGIDKAYKARKFWVVSNGLQYKSGIKHGMQAQTIDLSSNACTVAVSEADLQLKDAEGRVWNLRSVGAGMANRWKRSLLDASPNATEAEYVQPEEAGPEAEFVDGDDDNGDDEVEAEVVEAALVVIVDAMVTADGQAELKALFETLDTDDDGKVSGKEWGSKVTSNQEIMTKYFVKEKELDQQWVQAVGMAFKRIDKDADGSLTWDEFVAATATSE